MAEHVEHDDDRVRGASAPFAGLLPRSRGFCPGSRLISHASLPRLLGTLLCLCRLTWSSQFFPQPITICNEHTQKLLELAEHCLYLRSVETNSIQRRDNLMLSGNNAFAFRDVAQGKR